MLIDLHCHTSVHSSCSALNPAELAELARERGLDAVCLVEHDRWWDPGDLADVSRETGFAFFSGVELTVAGAHLLAFGLPQTAKPLTTVDDARCAAEETGALLYVAHPLRDGSLRLDDELRAACDSVEVVNGSDSALQDAPAAGLARHFTLPGIGGSDSHTAAEVGRAATKFERPVETAEQLVAELRAGRYRAIRLNGA